MASNRRVSLEDAARAVGRQPATVRKWITRGLFLDGEVLRGAPRGGGRRYAISLDAVRRIDAEERETTPAPLTWAELAGKGEPVRLRVATAPLVPVSAPVRAPATPRELPTRPLPPGVVSVKSVAMRHNIQRAQWLTKIRQRQLGEVPGGPWQHAGGAVSHALDVAGVADFGRAFAFSASYRECSDPACPTCEAYRVERARVEAVS